MFMWSRKSEVVKVNGPHHPEPFADGLSDAWHVDVDDVDAPSDGHVRFVFEVPVHVGERVRLLVGPDEGS